MRTEIHNKRLEIEIDSASRAVCSTIHSESEWYAAYTLSRHEKRVADRLQEKSVEYFLPVYQAIHKWKNKRARVVLPLFPGYIFVRISLKDRLQVLEVPGVVHIIGCSGVATPLPPEEVRLLQHRVTNQLGAKPHPYISVGTRVRIKSGPLAEVEGILIRKGNNCRIVLSLHCIGRSFAVEVPDEDVDFSTS